LVTALLSFLSVFLYLNQTTEIHRKKNTQKHKREEKTQKHKEMEKALRETQTLRAHCL